MRGLGPMVDSESADTVASPITRKGQLLHNKCDIMFLKLAKHYVRAGLPRLSDLLQVIQVDAYGGPYCLIIHGCILNHGDDCTCRRSLRRGAEN